MLSSLYHISSLNLYSFVSIELYIGHGVVGVNLFFERTGSFILGILKNDQKYLTESKTPMCEYFHLYSDY